MKKIILILLVSLISITVKSQSRPDSTFFEFNLPDVTTSDIVSYTALQFSQGRTLLRFNYESNDSIKVEYLLVRGDFLTPGTFILSQATTNRVLEGIINVRNADGASGTSFSFYADSLSTGILEVDSVRVNDWFGEIDFQVFHPITGQQINFTGILNKVPKQ